MSVDELSITRLAVNSIQSILAIWRLYLNVPFGYKNVLSISALRLRFRSGFGCLYFASRGKTPYLIRNRSSSGAFIPEAEFNTQVYKTLKNLYPYGPYDCGFSGPAGASQAALLDS